MYILGCLPWGVCVKDVRKISHAYKRVLSVKRKTNNGYRIPGIKHKLSFYRMVFCSRLWINRTYNILKTNVSSVVFQAVQNVTKSDGRLKYYTWIIEE